MLVPLLPASSQHNGRDNCFVTHNSYSLKKCNNSRGSKVSYFVTHMGREEERFNTWRDHTRTHTHTQSKER